ncbi:hypothetical protein E2C01_079035 [Portunus trituberculatus]|uniref:Uncharacterized protein n=1 Tax=Portunus trituberculatus TaxID=210409 RepID=A0A5B7IUH4_PORTR|nr:hypothetical protein [Portunus trituberculatus]
MAGSVVGRYRLGGKKRIHLWPGNKGVLSSVPSLPRVLTTPHGNPDQRWPLLTAARALKRRGYTPRKKNVFVMSLPASHSPLGGSGGGGRKDGLFNLDLPCPRQE